MSWTCDTCGQPINSAEDGWIEWKTRGYGERGYGLRLVHAHSASPRGEGHCQYDSSTFPNGEGLSDLDLEHFLTSDGLVRLLSFIARDDLPASEVLLMIQRLHVPNYETALPALDAAVSEGVTQPRMADGFFDQDQLASVISWGRAEGLIP